MRETFAFKEKRVFTNFSVSLLSNKGDFTYDYKRC